MNKFIVFLSSLLLGSFTSLCAAIPLPPAGADMIQFSGGFLSSSPPSDAKRMLKPFLAHGIAKAGSPLCNQTTDCTYIWIEQVVLDLSTGTGSGQGTINIVNNATLPTLFPSNIVKTFNFHETLDFTKTPFTANVTVVTDSGPVFFKELIHLPIRASEFNGGCPTAFCYSTTGDGLGENAILPIGPDQEVVGYPTTRTYLIHLP